MKKRLAVEGKCSVQTRVLFTYSVVIPLYWGCGLLGYYAYGEFADANINLNFPANAPNYASIVVQMVQELFFLYSTNLVLFLAIELAVGLDPSAACAPTWHGVPPWLGRLAGGAPGPALQTRWRGARRR